MKALVFDKRLALKNEVREVPIPVLRKNEVLISLKAVSINAADYRSIKLGMIPKQKIFGSAIAGIVEKSGGESGKFKEGDEVLADLSDDGFGGLAEYAAVPEKLLVSKPENLSFQDAVCLPVACTTAYKAIVKANHMKEGSEVLIVGSAGGVGSFAVQLASFYGARVTGVCSTKNLSQTQALGAQHVLDYTQQDFTKMPEKYDVIMAINGSYPLRAYVKVLKSNGVCVVVGGALNQILKAMMFGWIHNLRGKKLKLVAAKANADDLRYMAQLMSEGQIKSVIEKTYPLAESAQAMEYLSKKHAQGKIVIKI